MSDTFDNPTVMHRTAARVLLIRSDERILLVLGRDPYRPELGRWWFPIGGGIEGTESLEAAAVREVREETGIEDFELGPVVWVRSVDFLYLEDKHLFQREHYFVGRTGDPDVRAQAWTDYEQRQIMSMRWWGIDELCATDEVLQPPQLCELLAAVLAGDYPAEPIELSH